MPEDEENVFEMYDLDPMKGPAAITERMRELMETAPNEAVKKTIRRAWEALTMHPARRLRAALGAHPDSHGAVGAPPPSMPSTPCAMISDLELADVALRPSVLDAVGGEVPFELQDYPVERDPVLRSGRFDARLEPSPPSGGKA